MYLYNHTVTFSSFEDKIEECMENVAEGLTFKETEVKFEKKTFSFRIQFHNSQKREVTLYSNRSFSHNNEERVWLFEVKDVVSYLWKSSSMEIKFSRQQAFTQQLFEYWSLHIFLPLLFTIEQKYHFIHAGGGRNR